jgi:hemerythrin-like domain-containing protein
MLNPIGLFAQGPPKSGQTEEEISPLEDLMREHGVLGRVLLIYDEIVSRLKQGKEYPPDVLAGAAGIVRRFIEGYHEKLEEDYLFPRFERAGKLVGLVRTLFEQHQAGREATARIASLAMPSTVSNPEAKKTLEACISGFIRMYRPHKAREDTVLFPAFHSIISSKELDSLGDTFEDKERQLFGENGFEKIVEDVAALEKRMGILDLAQFTFKVS